MNSQSINGEKYEYNNCGDIWAINPFYPQKREKIAISWRAIGTQAEQAIRKIIVKAIRHDS